METGVISIKEKEGGEIEKKETDEKEKDEENLFENILNIRNKELNNNKIFKDKKKATSDYIPSKLPGREKECKEVASVLSDAFLGYVPMNMFIYGTPGTGKTSVIKKVFADMEKFQKHNKSNVRVITKYINCREKARSEYQVLLRILEDERLKNVASASGIFGDKLDGLAVEKLYEFLENVLKKGRIIMVLALDEVDAIKKNSHKDRLFYNLVRMNSDLNDDAGITVISTTNDMKFKEKLDPRTRSSLSKKDMFFEKYDAQQLERILEERVKLAFYDGVVEKSATSYAAGYVKKTYDGDVRYALNLLLLAGEIAEKEGKQKVTDAEVKKGCDVLNVDTLNEWIKRLYRHQMIVLYAVADAIFRKKYKRLIDIQPDAILSGEAYESYEEKCKILGEKPKTMRWFREYLNDLQKCDLLTLSESGKGIRGNTTIIGVGKYYTPKEVVEKVEALLFGDEIQKERQ